MKRLSLLSLVLVLSNFLSSCSMGYLVSFVNESDQNVEIIVLHEDFQKVNPRVMDLTDWKNNDRILNILLGQKTNWQEISKESIKEIPATSEITITLKPKEVLLYESVRVNSEHDENNPRGTAEQFRLRGRNGEILLKGENFYRQFEKGGGGIFFAYK